MAVTDDLVAFIRAAVADDRRVAEKAARFKYDHPSDAPWEHARLKVERHGGTSSDQFTARFNPARVLAECDATLSIIALAAEPDDPLDDEQVWYQYAVNDVLLLLALAYADRPGYREEWRP